MIVNISVVDNAIMSASKTDCPTYEAGCTYAAIHKHQRYRSKKGLIRCQILPYIYAWQDCRCDWWKMLRDLRSTRAVLACLDEVFQVIRCPM